MIPDLLLYGLLKIHSLSQTKYFYVLKLKILSNTCKQTPELIRYCIHFMQILHLIFVQLLQQAGPRFLAY